MPPSASSKRPARLRVAVGQAHLGRQIGHGQAFHRQRHRRAGYRTGEDEYRIAGLHFAFELIGQCDCDGQGLRRSRCRGVSRLRIEALAGLLDAALNGRARRVLRRQRRDQLFPVVDGLLKTLFFVGRDTEQAQAGDFRRIGTQGLIGQRLQLLGPLPLAGEVQRLRPLAQQLGRPFAQAHRTLEGCGGIAGALLSHISTAEEIPGLGRVGLAFYLSLQARGHFFDGFWLLGEGTRPLDIVDGAPVQIQAISQ